MRGVISPCLDVALLSVVGLRARRVARRHHGRRPAVLPEVEQPSVDIGVGVRHSPREGHARGLHPGCRGSDAQGAQSSPIGMQSLFRGM